MIPLYKVVLEREKNLKARKAIVTPQIAGEIIREVIGATDRETFICICLDTKNKPIGVNVVSIGSLNASIVHPREIYKAAILMNSACIMIGHNHPTGDTRPSAEDNHFTERMANLGREMGIELLDHVIVGDGNDEYYSYREKGVLS